MPVSENRLTEKVQAAVRAAVRDAGARSLLVACSGGGDSVCLAHATAVVAKQEALPVALGFFLHRVPSDDDQMIERVRSLAASLGVPFLFRERDEYATATDEATLRQARYSALAEMAAECGADAILTGHTLDDQAETVLLRLLRGSGVDGLAVMAPVGPLPVPGNDVRLVRPLLTITRAETHAYCHAHALPYRSDPSNADTVYARNWARHELIPTIAARYPAVQETLARTAALMRDDATFLQSLTDDALRRCAVAGDGATESVVALDRAAFAAEPVALQRRLLRLLLARYGSPSAHIEQIEGAWGAIMGTETHHFSVAGVGFWPVYGVVAIGGDADVRRVVRRRTLAHQPLLRLPEPLPMGEVFVFPPDDAAPEMRARLLLTPWGDDGPVVMGAVPVRLPDGMPLTLRNRRPGDRFRPPGAPGSRKVQDYLTEKDVPAPLRDEVVLLLAGDEIVAIIRYDVAARFHASAEDATHLYHLERVAPE